MADIFSAIAMIAENRIQEAMRAGEFDNLPGQGKPIVYEDTSQIPPELRMAWKILKNSGYVPPELEQRKEIGRLADCLDNCPDEREKLVLMQKLRLMLQKVALGRKSALYCEQNDEYYQKILARLASHEKG